jgi:DNA-3-methyladenine glycosylase II
MTRATPTGSTAAFRIEVALSKADPQLGEVIAAVVNRIGEQRPPHSKASPFEALVRAVIYQRMATSAAATIYQRLKATASGVLTPAKLQSLSARQVRSVGLSASKAAYVRNLAEWFGSHSATARKLQTLPDEEVITALTGISGVGLWTVNVFLIFSIQRPDVVPAMDLGVRRGVQLMCRMDKPASPEFVSERALRWIPYRSIACVYLWNAVRLKLTPRDLVREFAA